MPDFLSKKRIRIPHKPLLHTADIAVCKRILRPREIVHCKIGQLALLLKRFSRLVQLCQLILQRRKLLNLAPQAVASLPELPERIFLRGQLPLRLRLFFLKRSHT